VWVRLDLIIPDKEYAPLETMAMALEVVLASKEDCSVAIFPNAIPSCRGHGLPLVSTASDQSIHDLHEHV